MDLKESQEIKRAYEQICDNLKKYGDKENINYEVQSELNLYPKNKSYDYALYSQSYVI